MFWGCIEFESPLFRNSQVTIPFFNVFPFPFHLYFLNPLTGSGCLMEKILLEAVYNFRSVCLTSFPFYPSPHFLHSSADERSGSVTSFSLTGLAIPALKQFEFFSTPFSPSPLFLLLFFLSLRICARRLFISSSPVVVFGFYVALLFINLLPRWFAVADHCVLCLFC